MAHRRNKQSKHKLPPKTRDIELSINIWGDRFQSEGERGRRHQLKDFKGLLEAAGFQVAKAQEPVNSPAGNARIINIVLKTTESRKSKFFERFRREWCSSICQRGDSFWMESETPKDTFKYKTDETRQMIRVASFSFGTFTTLGTYVQHWSSEQDSASIQEGSIESEFQHDLGTFTIFIFKEGAIEGSKEIKFEMEHRQFENYVVVDENVVSRKISFYFPLQWPPKIFEEVTINDHTNYDRLTHFFGCSREILGSSSVLCLNFPLKERILERDEADSPLGLMTGLSRRGFSLCFANIKTNFPRGITEVPRKPTLSDPKIMYALECLLSRGFKVRDRISRKFYDMLRNATDRYGSLQENNLVSPEKVCKALYRLVSIVETDRFCPLVHYLEKLLYGDMMHLTAFEFEIPKHYAYVPRLIVTPTQDYLLPAELVAENRVIREYGHERAMRIAFREEDFSKLSSTHPEGLKHVLKERVVELLSKDVHIAGRKFEFLACSNSQLRDHGAWLYDTEGEHRAADIRGSLGQLNEIRCVATYVSRMGQCFSSTKEAVTVSIEVGCKVEKIPDVEVEYNNVYFECCRNLRSGKYTFSDGVGKISRALAEKVADSLSLEPTPSAYQIRYGGCKGMLAIDPRLPNGDNQEILQYRKSMEKFNSKHSALEICEATKPNLLYLNRQCIILLNGLGVPDESFISLQDKMLRSLALMLLFETVALETLQRANIPGGLKITALSRSGLNVTREPFFRSLLLAIYKSRLGDLLRRARIAIPETHGRLLMGVIDETGSLEYGQVFVRYSKLVSQPGKQLEILKGKVVISKNPCFHPGDMRIFEAVDIPALHHLVDCLVFPAKGHRPHSDEMSGSDLDGDKYFVTWYEKLLPRKDNVAPMDFTSPEKMELQRPIEVSDMIQFVAEYIKNDQLGIIANAHLVHADHDEEGVFSDACIRLAHMHSDAVDFPKTGKCPSLPKELRPDQYPDFMMKSGKPRYNSQRILGKLFRKCKSLDRAQQFSAEASQSQIIPDPDLIVQGYEHYLEEAEAVKIHYNTKLDGLMSLYGLRNEGEVITGCLVKVNTRLAGKTDEKFEVAQMIQASLSTLRAKTRHDFYDEFGGEDEVMEEFEENGHFAEEILQKASAWYMTTYGDRGEGEVQRTASSTDPNQQREKGDRKRLLSFPWVVDRILANIKKGKKQERERDGTQAQHAMGAVGDLITEQAAYFFDKLKSELVDIRKVQIEERDKLKDTLNLLLGEARAPRLALFDSSLTGISVGDEQQTSVGIYIHVKWNASEKEQYEYLQWLGRALSREGDVKMQRHPLVLHFQRGSSQGLKLLRQDFYITADSNRFQKSAYVSMQVQRCPRLLHLLLILIHWGRRRRIIGNSRNSFLSDENLATIFLVFCEESDFINKLSSADMQNFSSRHLGLPSSVEQTEAERVWSNEVLGEDYQERLKGLKGDKTPGHLLIKFFEHYSLVADDDPLHIRIMTNPVKSQETLCQNVSTEESNRFSDAALHAFHELAQCCGLDSFTASRHTESTRELKETLSMPNTTWGALRFAEEFVRVKLSTLTSAQISLRPAQNGYILEATGNYLTLHTVQNELKKIETTCRSYIYDHTVSGASRFLFLDQNGPNDMVNFKQLQRGDYAVNLDPLNGLLRHGLGLDDGPNSDLVEQKFLSLISSQMGVFKQEYLPYVHGADRLMIRVEFGSIYVQNARFDAPRVGAVEDMLSQNADSTNRPGSSQAQKRKLMTHKFIPVLDCGESWTAAFPTILHDSFAETYTLGIKEGRNHTKTVRYDSELQFCDVDIPPINWVVADVKAPRRAGAKSRDIDFRVTVCSQRKLEDDKDVVMSSPGYEMFSTKSILSKPGNMSLDLELASGFQTKVSYVRHDKTSIYKISDGNLFLQVKEVMKYEGKGSRFLKPSKNSTEVQIFGFFDGKGDPEEAMKVSRNLWSAAKRLRPHIR